MTDMTPRQARQAQLDAWQARHGFHHRLTPESRTAATMLAVNNDHAAALEMNANDDAGRAAFLGTERPIMIPAPSRPARIAALHAAGLFLAEHIDLPMPAVVQMHVHNLTYAQIQAMADLHGASVTFGDTYSHVAIPVALETLHGITIEYLAHGALPDTTPRDLPRRVGVVLPENDPWADAMPSPRPRCTVWWRDLERGAPSDSRCVYQIHHGGNHFFDDDETNGGHRA